MATKHGYCPLHKIAYNREFDSTCPQCMLGRILPPEQLDFGEVATTVETFAHRPLDASGKPVDL